MQLLLMAVMRPGSNLYSKSQIISSTSEIELAIKLQRVHSHFTHDIISLIIIQR